MVNSAILTQPNPRSNLTRRNALFLMVHLLFFLTKPRRGDAVKFLIILNKLLSLKLNDSGIYVMLFVVKSSCLMMKKKTKYYEQKVYKKTIFMMK